MPGFDRRRLARLDAHLAGAVERGVVAGAVALLWRDGQEHAAVAGVQDLATGAPMRRDTIFRLASVTKLVLSAATLALVEDGRLALPMPVERLLPELADRRVLCASDGPLDRTVPAARPISLRDLLTMRMGLGANMGPPTPLSRAMEEAGIAPGPGVFGITPETWLARLAALPLAHQPGERWLYHTAHDVLGLLLAREAGSLEAALRGTVLDPLAMRDTAFHVPEAKLDRLATAYAAGPDGRLAVYDAARGGRFARPAGFESGGGGLVSTADDLLRFARMLLAAGRLDGQRVLGPGTVRAMATDQLTPEQKAASPFFPAFWESFGWGLGVAVVTRRTGPAMSPGRFGWDGGFGTSLWVDPEARLAGVLLTQRNWDEPFTALRDAVWTMAAAALDD